MANALQAVDAMVGGFFTAMEVVRARSLERSSEQVQAQERQGRIASNIEKIQACMLQQESENARLRANLIRLAFQLDYEKRSHEETVTRYLELAWTHSFNEFESAKERLDSTPRKYPRKQFI